MFKFPRHTQFRYECFYKSIALLKGGSRVVPKFLQESILIAFDLIWKVLLSDKNFATPLDPPLLLGFL